MIDPSRKKDSHLIQCTHPYFINLGLGTMTTGSIVDWWNTQNGAGVYINRRNFFASSGPNDKMGGAGELLLGNYGKMLGLDKSGETEFFWNGWKPNPEQDLDGRYLRQNLSDDPTTLDTPDDYEGEGGKWEYTSKVGKHLLEDTLYYAQKGSRTIYIGGKYNDSGGAMEPLSVVDDNFFSLSNALGPVFALINCNNYMNAHDDLFPVEIWDVNDEETYGNPDDDNALKQSLWSTQALMEDIKTNKGGSPCVQFSGEITMYVGETNGFLRNCAITEWVKFNLYLYDERQAWTNTKGLALPIPKIVAPRRDVATGKSFATSADGGWTKGEGDEVAADLDVFLNPVTKKWESGSPNLFAKLTEDIAKLKNSPDIDDLIESNIAVDLNKSKFNNRFVVSSGIAMPIRVQNGNNLQWTPNYANPEDVRCNNEDFTKETLVVYNMSTARTFRKNEEVMLSRIDGRWIVSQLGIDPLDEDDPAEIGGEAGKWGEFTYLMTNADYFFQGRSSTGGWSSDFFTPRSMEQDFHYRYYRGLEGSFGLNVGFDYGVSGGYDSLNGFQTVLWDDNQLTYVPNGFAQVTSFDSLDSKLFGRRGEGGRGQRDACGIASTNPTVTSAGKDIPVDVTEWQAGYRNGAHTCGFFGALFPDGYIDAGVYATARDWITVPIDKAKSILPLGSTYRFLRPSTKIATGDEPFSDEGATNNNVDALFLTRNNVHNPVNVNPVQEPYPSVSDAKMEWLRLNQLYGDDFKTGVEFPAAASLFHESSNGDMRLRHIPADVCLNASPEDGSYGSPLRSVHRFANFHPSSLYDDDQTVREATKAQIACEYIGKDFGDEDPRTGGSAFDFQPVNPAHIMFRPLKLESYNQFGTAKKDGYATFLAKNPLREARSVDRLGFEVEIHRTQSDFCRPVTHLFEDRELSRCDDDLYDSSTGLKYGPETVLQFLGNPKRQQYSYWATENAGPGFGGQEPGAFQWANSNEGWDKGAAAYGIITTYTTVRATRSIDFTTDNLYGMGPNVGRSNNQAGNIKFRSSHSWGSDNTSYFQGNCPNLSVRVFHEHPRNQTLYDPRTFAVHHFNPDMRFVLDTYMDDGGETGAIPTSSGGKSVTTGNGPRNTSLLKIPGRNSEGGMTFIYNTPVPSSEVDYIIPSRYRLQTDESRYNDNELHQQGEIYTSIPLQNGQVCFSDRCLEFGGQTLTPLMDERHWQVETSRVGKLLPYAYSRLFLGVTLGTFSTESEYWTPTTVDIDNNRAFSSEFDGGQTAYDLRNNIISDGVESGFAVGDVIGIPSKSLTFKVTVVDEFDGRIRKVEIVDPGSFSISDIDRSDSILIKDYEGKIKFEVITSLNGIDLNWSVTSVAAYNRLAIDPKPLMVKKDGASVVSISATDSQPGFQEGFQPVSEVQAQSFISKNEDTSIILDQANLSSNTAYDLFFHFHNDITMTWLACKEGFYGAPRENSNAFPVHEQHISARISTT